MKKKNIILVIVICCAIILSGIIVFVINSKPKQKGLIILDGNGETLTVLQSDMELNESEIEYQAYIEAAVQEAIQLMAEKEDSTEEEIEKEIFNGEYTLYTSFDRTAFSASQSAYKSTNFEDIPFATVVTAYDGRILSIYNGENSGNINYALEKTQAYSAFKPLSVYAPAIEKNVISWTSAFVDSPIKKITSSSTGTLIDWPSNGNGIYTNEDVSISEGIRKSLNTTAIRTLQELGVKSSTDFLSEKLGIDISQEIQTMEQYGEDEILGAIGLGYLRTGVSPVDMAGYYQIFVRGGQYTEPYTIIKINKGSLTTYQNENTSETIISEETAFIMNKLLQTTTEDGGTAEKARYEDVKIGAKTGTGSNYNGNWIVGYTPEYICSIWHGRNISNVCAKTFSELMAGLEHDKTKDFISCNSVVEIPCCKESGLKLTANCKDVEVGYFKSDYEMKTCNIH